jgi:hypothetical protein
MTDDSGNQSVIQLKFYDKNDNWVGHINVKPFGINRDNVFSCDFYFYRDNSNNV